MSERLEFLMEKQEETGLNYREHEELENLMEGEDLINWRDR
jgi:hypothetical protein